MRSGLRKGANIIFGARAAGLGATVRLGTVVGGAVVTILAVVVAGIWLSGEAGPDPSPRNGAIAFVILSLPVGIYLGWRLSPSVALGQSTVRLALKFAIGLTFAGALWIAMVLGLLAGAFLVTGANPVVGAVAALPLFVGTTLFYSGFLLLFFGLPAFLVGIPAGLVWATTVRLLARRRPAPGL